MIVLIFCHVTMILIIIVTLGNIIRKWYMKRKRYRKMKKILPLQLVPDICLFPLESPFYKYSLQL